MISINFTLFAQILHFLVLVWIFNRLMIRPIMRNVQAKKDDLNGRQETIAGLLKESADRESAYQERLRQARLETMNEREKLIHEARTEADELRRKAAKESASLMVKVRADLETSLNEVRQSLRAGEEALAHQLSEVVLGRKA